MTKVEHKAKSPRTTILGKIRQSLGRGGAQDDAILRQEVAQRLAQRERGIVPARANVDHEAQIALFRDYSHKVSGTTERLASYDVLPAAITHLLRDRNLPQSIRTGEDERLNGIDWSGEPQLERLVGPSDGKDLVALSHAMGGVAETGTVLLTSGRDNPTTLNFLPETHLIVIDAKDIVGDYETLQDRLYDADGKAVMPRVLNRVTGPSRSGDIEQTILLGAHGPKDVHIFIIG